MVPSGQWCDTIIPPERFIVNTMRTPWRPIRVLSLALVALIIVATLELSVFTLVEQKKLQLNPWTSSER
jgi:hypothetical protein